MLRLCWRGRVRLEWELGKAGMGTGEVSWEALLCQHRPRHGRGTIFGAQTLQCMHVGTQLVIFFPPRVDSRLDDAPVTTEVETAPLPPLVLDDPVTTQTRATPHAAPVTTGRCAETPITSSLLTGLHPRAPTTTKPTSRPHHEAAATGSRTSSPPTRGPHPPAGRKLSRRRMRPAAPASSSSSSSPGRRAAAPRCAGPRQAPPPPPPSPQRPPGGAAPSPAPLRSSRQ